ncbi:5-methyltetrahydropteroyltriglutamate--homocysteine S-methyltransferase [Paenibacillus sp. SC116]|uniref:5-methyltetrahydropteroyltriglutamate-- homocysteine S-methyltransferase n=1 Tax=Paenibacillus sp. SC116 TaxID=2968986 RepID=UPI00215B5BFB|nr:5-methyltetrahydropteroyltriglutamate--homocysteine S-methyltransferase [Paenibacillus sp. SC116]MCR8845544.1 5-methyltetrahydropteroyltriglutamate--homocysteine S-methyltransferase [Paenibacillus sp. SC116]
MTGQNNAAQVTASVIGYPRIGKQREWKKALEAYWAGKSDYSQTVAELDRIEVDRLQHLADAGLNYIPVNDYSWYDHVLDQSVTFGIIPERFHSLAAQIESCSQIEAGQTSIPQEVADLAFAIARGTAQHPASEMTKWFNTNYHYIVPEWSGQEPQLLVNLPLLAVKRAKQALADRAAVLKPVLIGPYTFVRLMKGIPAAERAAVIAKLTPVYVQLLQSLEAEGVQVVQLDEPAWIWALNKEEQQQVQATYDALRQAVPSLELWVQTYFEAVADYTFITSLPVDVIGLDFVHGKARNEASLKQHGFPADKRIAIGVLDGRNVWRTDLQAVVTELEQTIEPVVAKERWIVQPSCSLLHVPLALREESKLSQLMVDALAGAEEKLVEIVTIANALNDPSTAKELLAASSAAVQAWRTAPERQRPQVREALKDIHQDEKLLTREAFQERLKLQEQRWPQLPLLPTTSIGSLPQTLDVRKARQRFRKGEWDLAAYTEYLQAEMKRWVEIQEEIGIDVLVHGEFERTDMVEYFGEKLDGFVFTQNGWVQSYGSRCVKPPLLYGDIAFRSAMTVEETEFAQTLTKQPVKGMLTGPVTILNWSFVRDDLSREEVSYQLAWALRQEIIALEEAGIGMIQVDEPAVKEGMPLHADDAVHYRKWTVDAFRLATAGVRPDTQIHTHMCYCDFSDMVDLIRDMDADVISLETARSGGDIVEAFSRNHYELGIGLGVYDIHSPRVPSVEEMEQCITRALEVLPARTFWINPDCGLKTRGEKETIEALKNMTEAAARARKKLAEASATPTHS